MKTVIVKDGVVVNVTEAGSLDWTPPPGTLAVDVVNSSPVARGWTYDGATFTEAALDDEATIGAESWQLKLELFERGSLVAVEAAINALAEPAKTRALIRWNSGFVGLEDKIADLIKTTLALTRRQTERLFISALKK